MLEMCLRAQETQEGLWPKPQSSAGCPGEKEPTILGDPQAGWGQIRFPKAEPSKAEWTTLE